MDVERVIDLRRILERLNAEIITAEPKELPALARAVLAVHRELAELTPDTEVSGVDELREARARRRAAAS